jgi:hypothetical protein
MTEIGALQDDPRVVLLARQPPQLRESDPSIKRNFGDAGQRHDLSWP